MSHIISWMPHGRAWKVVAPSELETEVLGKYFRQSRYASFARQINGWGFRRITQGPDKNCYYHELFLRGMPHLIKWIKRHSLPKNVSAEPCHNPNNEPDFYHISKMFPIPNYYEIANEQAINAWQQSPPRHALQDLTRDQTKQAALKPECVLSLLSQEEWHSVKYSEAEEQPRSTNAKSPQSIEQHQGEGIVTNGPSLQTKTILGERATKSAYEMELFPFHHRDMQLLLQLALPQLPVYPNAFQLEQPLLRSVRQQNI
eukprot:3120454-Ditylum_brightwellii.AAC.1